MNAPPDRARDRAAVAQSRAAAGGRPDRRAGAALHRTAARGIARHPARRHAAAARQRTLRAGRGRHALSPGAGGPHRLARRAVAVARPRRAERHVDRRRDRQPARRSARLSRGADRRPDRALPRASSRVIPPSCRATSWDIPTSRPGARSIPAGASLGRRWPRRASGCGRAPAHDRSKAMCRPPSSASAIRLPSISRRPTSSLPSSGTSGRAASTASPIPRHVPCWRISLTRSGPMPS